ncbi:MAG: hypothetical protein CMO01_06720 [Thalassobius sp.]|nr:hypothetical protein [Thalassovita sp.]
MSKIRDKFKSKQEPNKSEPDRFSAFDSAIMQLAKVQIEISSELEKLIPPLQSEEIALLKESIAEEGVRDPLLLWKSPEGKDILVDGHNRFRIINELEAEGVKVKYGTKFLELADFEAVKDWMIINQLGRRNLTNEQRSYLRGLRYEREKQGHGGERPSPQNGNMRTHQRLADEYKVSKNTILRDSEFARGIEAVGKSNAALKQQILAGNAPVKKGDLQLLGKVSDQLKSEINTADELKTIVKKLKQKAAPKPKVDQTEVLKKEILEKTKLLNAKSKKTDYKKLHKLLEDLEKAYLEK